MNVFVYGTLLSGNGNNRLLSGSALVGKRTLTGFDMVTLGGFPAIEPGAGTVVGEVYEINEETLDRLDGLEGYTEGGNHNLYERETITTDDGITAFVYVMPGCKEEYPPLDSGDWNNRHEDNYGV